MLHTDTSGDMIVKYLKTMAAVRHFKVIDFGANRKPICNFLVDMLVSPAVIDILTHRPTARKQLVFPPALVCCLTPPLGESRQNFWMKLIS